VIENPEYPEERDQKECVCECVECGYYVRRNESKRKENGEMMTGTGYLGIVSNECI